MGHKKRHIISAHIRVLHAASALSPARAILAVQLLAGGPRPGDVLIDAACSDPTAIARAVSASGNASPCLRVTNAARVRVRTVVTPVVRQSQQQPDVARLRLRHNGVQRAEGGLVQLARVALQRARTVAVAERPGAHDVQAQRLCVVLRARKERARRKPR